MNNRFIKIVVAAILGVVFTAPSFAVAQSVTFDQLASQSMQSRSGIVIDQVTGEVVWQLNATMPWVPASLTKLTSAQVILDTKPNLAKTCTVRASDEVGGARLTDKTGDKYRLIDLLHASLIGSANNATNTAAGCVGLTRDQFIARMNAKAKSLGAASTHFVDPAGMDPANVTTAEDYAKIANAALSTEKLRNIMKLKTYTFKSVSTTPRRTHTMHTTNLLLGDPGLNIIAGKTGYLDESMYNFVESFRDVNGRYMIALVFGAPTRDGSFADAKSLAQIDWTKYAAAPHTPVVVSSAKAHVASAQ